MQILLLLLPLFATIALGAVLQRSGFFGPQFLVGVNKLTYWVGLPVLVVVSLATAEHGDGSAGRLLLVLVVATGVSVGSAWGIARFLRVSPSGQGTWVQAAFRGNLTFVGLPILLTLPGIPRTAAILVMAPLLIVYNAVSVALLVASRHRAQAGLWGLMLREVVRNPVILASALGGVLYAANITLWLPVERTLRQISLMAVPLALLCIGGALVTTPFRGNRKVALVAALFKTVVSPMIGYAVSRWFHLDPGETRVVLLLMACPTAAISFTMVRQLGGDEAVAAGAIVLSTLFSIGALSAILSLS